MEPFAGGTGPERPLAVRTMCGMFCHPTMCGMIVETADNQVLTVRGDPQNPDSRGFLCVRGQSAPEIVHSQSRLDQPLIRLSEERWAPIYWEKALDVMCERMAAVGREQVGILYGHGAFQSGLGSHLISRFANLYGCQRWAGSINCWVYGALGFAISGIISTHTKEDLGAHSNLIVLWGADLASQPNTGRFIAQAKRRGALVVTIDCRAGDNARLSDQVILIRPGTDAALALGLMHVIVAEGAFDSNFVKTHALGFPELCEHLRDKTPEWACAVTGVDPEKIRNLARLYAARKPAMIVAGGSSMYKHSNGWLSSRAISCLPALTGNLGIPGGGLGPRHSAPSSVAEELAQATLGAGMRRERVRDISAKEKRLPGNYIAHQQEALLESVLNGKIRVLLVFGSNLLSHFPDSTRLENGLKGLDLVVTHDLFMNETTRRVAHLALPGTSWLEELGYRVSNTHVYLMEQAVPPIGQARSNSWVLNELASRCKVEGYFPWADHGELIDTLIDTPAMGSLTVAKLRAMGGIAALPVSDVAYPNFRFDSPSGKVEFWSERCLSAGLPPLPVYEEPLETQYSRPDIAGKYPLVLRPGRTINQFNSFYDESKAVPPLLQRNRQPILWVHPSDAGPRMIKDGDPIVIFNDRGEFEARAKVTVDVIPGVVWMRTGWFGFNQLTNSKRALPDALVEGIEGIPFPVGQSIYEALVDVARTEKGDNSQAPGINQRGAVDTLAD